MFMARRPGRAAGPRRREALQPRGRPALGPPPLQPPPARRHFRGTPPEAPEYVSSGGAGIGPVSLLGLRMRGTAAGGGPSAAFAEAESGFPARRALVGRFVPRLRQGSAARLFQSMLISCCRRRGGLGRCSGREEWRGRTRSVPPPACAVRG